MSSKSFQRVSSIQRSKYECPLNIQRSKYSTTAVCFGALTGGVGTMCAGAAGGGIVGNLVWRPGFAAINTSGQLIASNQ